MPVTNSVCRQRLAARKLVSSTPIATTSASRLGSSISGAPYSRTARITVPQSTPRAAATAATSRLSCPTSWHASRRARSVRQARTRICSLTSVRVPTSHAGSGQRHSRLSHTSVTGRPPHGKSRTLLRRRP